jgi:hypothetical protein
MAVGDKAKDVECDAMAVDSGAKEFDTKEMTLYANWKVMVF